MLAATPYYPKTRLESLHSPEWTDARDTRADANTFDFCREVMG